MEQQTLELLRALQSGERDAGAFKYIRTLLPQERTRLAAAEDRATLADISELLEVWADSASPELAGAAAAEAAQIADEDLEQAERAAQLYQLALERAPKELESLRKLDALFCRRGQHERLEAALVAHAERLRVASDAQPAAVAGVYRRLGQLRAERGSDLSPAIEAYERALDLAVDTDIIRELADLYSKRRGQGDGAQAADLYCMLAEVLGAGDGVAMLERALDLAPGHDAALELLESYVPLVDHPSTLQGRWAAYIERSDNEQGVDRRRGLLARAYAAQGQQRNALICLGPLIEKGDAEALRMQVAVLAALQAQEQSESAPTARAKSGNGAIVRPATLVGFRVPAPDEADEADEPAGETHREDPPSELTAAQHSAVAAASEVAAKAAQQGEAKPVRQSEAKPVRQSEAMAAQHAEARPVRQSEAKPMRQSEAKAAQHADAQLARQSEAKPVRQSEAKPTQHADAKPMPQNDAKPARQSEAKAAQHTHAGLVPQSEAKPAERTEAQPVQQGEAKALRVRPARSGETLVGFRLPQALSGLEVRSPSFAKGPQSVAGGSRAKAERVDKRAKADAKPEAHAKGAAVRGSAGGVPAASAKTVAAESGATAAARSARPSAAVSAPQSPARMSTSSARTSSQPAAAGAAAKAAALRASRPQVAGVGASSAFGAAAPAQRTSAPRISAPAPVTPRVSSHPAAMAAPAAAAARVSAPPAFPVAPQPAVLAEVASVAAPLADVGLDPDDGLPPSQPVGSDKRWLIAGGIAVALTVTVGVLALGPGPKPPSLVAPTRGEAVAPQPAAAPMPEPPPAPPPSTGPVTSAAAPSSPHSPVEPGGPTAAQTTAPTSAASPVQEEPAPRSKKSAKTPPAGRLVPGKAHVLGGGLSAQQIALVLEDTLPLIERCYAEALDDKPRLQGRAVFGWTIEKNGHPTHVRTLSGTLKDDKLQQCSLEALRKARFPKPKKKSSEITWPLDFKKS